jgi:cell wall-associated NlpC family hydrolase
MKRLLLLYAVMPLFSLLACTTGKSVSSNSEVDKIIAQTKKDFIPDGRLSVYDVKCVERGSRVVLKGCTMSAEAKKALLERVSAIKKHVTDSVTLLPDAALGDKTYGVVDVSVCNVRAADDFSAELSLQALLGMPVRIIQDEMFYRVQTPDLYTGWVHHTGITPMTKAEYDAWNRAVKIIVTAHYGFAYSRPDAKSQTVSDVVSGDRLKWEGTEGDFYKVSYPDGRIAYLSKTVAMTEREWRSSIKQDAASIIKTAYSLMGIPYMWGANSAKSADCSGFVRTVLFLHDIIIPRDASQMAYIGQHIDIAPACSNLQPGDLVFFGRKAGNGKKEHVSHVGLYVGNQRFIHSMGDVHESSFNPKDANYDAYNLGRRLHAVRFLPYLNKVDNINTTITNSFYK